MKSAVFFVLAGIMFIVQMVISLAAFDDLNGAILGSGFVIIMFAGSLFAWKGGLMQIDEKSTNIN